MFSVQARGCKRQITSVRLHVECLEIRELLAAGALDTGFGVGGKALANFTGSFGDQGMAVALQPDGKVVVAGSVFRSGTAYDFGLVRFNADGTLDSGFGTGGLVVTSVGTNNDFAQGVAIQPDGKIVVVGYGFAGATGNDFAVVRYFADGTLDNSFGSGGKVLTAFGSNGAFDAAASVVLQADGAIVVAGQSNANGTNNDFAVVRYLSDGSVDGSFGVNGRATANFQGNSLDNGYAVALQADGKILVGGSSLGATNDFGLVRFTTSGAVDTGFGTLGFVQVNVGTNTQDVASALAVQDDGKIVLAGYAFNGNYDFALIRVNAAGTLDGTFDVDGKLTTNFSGASADTATGVALQGDGRIVAAGFTGSDFALVRYLGNGSLDTTFGTGGRVSTNFGGTDVGKGVVLQSDGKIVVAGYSNGAGTGDDFAVARYLGSDNQPPVANAGGPYAVAEGATVALSALGSTDPNQSSGTLLYEWDLDGNGSFETTGATPTFSAVGLDGPSSVTVGLRVTDNGGLTNTTTMTVTITNVLQTVDAGPDQTVREGDTVSFSGFVSDPAPDTFTYHWTVSSDNVQVVPAGDQQDFSFVPNDNGVYTITLLATDDDGNVVSDTVVVTAENVDPGASISGAGGGVRGQTRTFVLAASDASSVDTTTGLTFVVDWGDNSPVQSLAGGASTQANHAFTQAGTYTIQVTARDKDGGVSAAASMTVTIGIVELQPSPIDPGKLDLVVGGTSHDDRITFRSTHGGSNFVVTVNGVAFGGLKPTGRIVAFGQAGDDTIHLSDNILLAAWLSGGDGNDSLQGGGDDDVLFGGAGDDLLHGVRGQDVLIPGTGNDRKPGSKNADTELKGDVDYVAYEAAWIALAG